MACEICGLVYRLAYNGDVVAFKMGRRQGAWRALYESIRNRQAYVPAGPFSTQPPGRASWLFFCALDPYDSDMGALPPVRLGPP